MDLKKLDLISKIKKILIKDKESTPNLKEKILTKNKKEIILSVIVILISIWLLTPIMYFASLEQENIFQTVIDKDDILEMYLNPFINIKTLILNPGLIIKEVMILIMLCLIGYIVVLAVKNSPDYRDGKVIYAEDNGTNGTAKWLDRKEAEKILEFGSNNGICYGEVDGEMVTLSEESFFNKNIAVFGASGSMKSRAFGRNNILQLAKMGQSMVITDPKGEMAQDMREMLEKDFGYKVKIFNLVSMQHSDRWNPLDEISDQITAQTFSEIVISNTESGHSGGDAFWSRTEQNLLKALALYVKIEMPKEQANIGSMYKILSAESQEYIDGLFESLPNDHPAKAPYNIYAQASENVRTSVIIGLGTRLQVFQVNLVKELTSTSDIDLEELGKEKCVYFCIISDSESTFDFIAGLFFSFLFIRLTKYADRLGGVLPVLVTLILDEFPNIPAITDFNKKISTIRSRGIRTFVIFQNIGQLQNRYPDNVWAEIIGNCDTRLFLGCTDLITAEFVSENLGVATVKDFGKAKQAGFKGIFDMGKIMEKTTKRNLLNSDEILRFPQFEAILMIKGNNPLRLNKLDYTKHELAYLIKPKLVKEYKPAWSKKYQDVDKSVDMLKNYMLFNESTNEDVDIDNSNNNIIIYNTENSYKKNEDSNELIEKSIEELTAVESFDNNEILINDNTFEYLEKIKDINEFDQGKQEKINIKLDSKDIELMANSSQVKLDKEDEEEDFF